MIKTIQFLTACCLCSISTLCYSFGCDGTVDYLGIGTNGTVFVSITGSTPTAIHGICNVQKQDNFGMSVASCKAAYATLLTAHTTSKKVGISYDYGNTSGLNCATLPQWGVTYDVWFVAVHN